MKIYLSITREPSPPSLQNRHSYKEKCLPFSHSNKWMASKKIKVRENDEGEREKKSRITAAFGTERQQGAHVHTHVHGERI